MAAQIENRPQFIPQGFSVDGVQHQWRINGNEKIVSILKDERNISICHVFNTATQKYTVRPIIKDRPKECVRSKFENREEKCPSWKKMVPVVVDTPKGPMCVFKKENEKCWSKSHIKVDQSSILVWTFSKEVGFKYHHFIFSEPKIETNLDIVILCLKTNRVKRERLSSVPYTPLYPIIPTTHHIHDLDTFSRTRFYELFMDALPYRPNNYKCSEISDRPTTLEISDQGSILNVAYDEQGLPTSVDRRPLTLQMDLSIGDELGEMAPNLHHTWKVNRKEIHLTRRNNQIIYIIRDIATQRGILWNVYKDNLSENEAQQEMARLSEKCIYLEDDNRLVLTKISRRWDVENNKELWLVKESGRLRWWLFDKTTQTSFRSNIRICEELAVPRARHVLLKTSEYPPDPRAWAMYHSVGYILNWGPTYGIREDRFNPSLPGINLTRNMEYGGTDRCSSHTKMYLNNLGELSKREQLIALEDFNLKRVKVFNANKAKFISVALEPSIIKRSKIDPRVNITKFMWAVTIVRVGKIKGTSAKKSVDILKNRNFLHKEYDKLIGNGQHAQIIIEGVASCNDYPIPGVQKDQQFCIMCDFDGASGLDKESPNRGPCESGPSRVAVKDISSDSVFYIERSQVWKRSHEQVIKMIDLILREYRREVPLPNLHIMGGVSVSAEDGDESCITWLKDKFEIIDVYLPDPLVGKNIITYTSDFTYSEEYHRDNIPEDHDSL